MLYKIKKKIKSYMGITDLNNRFEKLEEEFDLQSQKLINASKTIKVLQHKKIHVIFVCHRPHIWNSLKSICDSCIEDPDFTVTIVAIPNKKQLPNCEWGHEVYESEGAETFFKSYTCKVINGYNYKTGKWLDLRGLSPDYLFFQTPYNICRPPQYNSQIVKHYTRLCYVTYGAQILGGDIEDSVYPFDFMNSLSFVFMDLEIRKNYYIERLKNSNIFNFKNLVYLGFPRFDNLDSWRKTESPVWKQPKNKGLYRIIWTPRWTLEEENCNFFDYKDLILEYAKCNTDIELVFRPHPQCFANFVATGQMSGEDILSYKNRFNQLDNASIDNQASYMETFFSSNLLITDGSSIMAEYFLTGNPIIYCHKVKDNFTVFGKEVSKGCYWASNWSDVVSIIDKLKNGQDDLKNIRKTIRNSYFKVPAKGAGHAIKEYLKKDFYTV